EQVLKQVASLIEAGTDPQEVAVLYRTNIQVRAIIDGLVERGLPFTLHDADGDFYRRWQVRDVLTYFKLAYDPDDLDGLVQIMNRPKRYLYPERWVEQVHQLHREKGWSYLRALRQVDGLEGYHLTKIDQLVRDLNGLQFQTPAQALRTIRVEIGYDKYLEEYAEKTGNDLKAVSEPLDELEQAVVGFRTIPEFLAHVQEVAETIRKARFQGDGIQLMTMHRAKGLEFEHVYCIGLVDEMMPHFKALLQPDAEKRAAALEEERRLLYVGLTRAKRFLTLSAPQRYHGKKADPSPFLYETGLLERPKAIASGRISSGTLYERGKTEEKRQKQAEVQRVPAQERMRMALEKFGSLDVKEGDTLFHKDMGPGLIDSIKPLSGEGGRRVLVKFPDQEKLYDVHLELTLYLGLMQAGETVR
ncbi:MAG TPA: ATP-dependent helicase, partial [Bacilli bacterium]|nr:ATP-dependent helicase [Bacilli bacterium]